MREINKVIVDDGRERDNKQALEYIRYWYRGDECLGAMNKENVTK
jgi:hypothetical protein